MVRTPLLVVLVVVSFLAAWVVGLPAAAQSTVGEMIPMDADVEEESTDARVLYLEAVGAFRRLEMAESARLFDRQLEVAPDDKPGLWERGISLYYAGRWTDCADQFEAHRRVNPDDAENAIWHYLCTARAEGHDAARARLFDHDDHRVPMREVWDLYRGMGSVEEVLEAAETGGGEMRPTNRKLAIYYGNLYVALWYEVHGDAERSLEHLRRGLRGLDSGHYMEMVGRAHLRLREAELAGG